jgi:hypothetical protein
MEGPPSGYWLPIFARRLRRRSQSIFHADDINERATQRRMLPGEQDDDQRK